MATSVAVLYWAIVSIASRIYKLVSLQPHSYRDAFIREYSSKYKYSKHDDFIHCPIA